MANNKKEEPQTYKPNSFNSQNCNRINNQTTCKYLEKNKMMSNRQHGFVRKEPHQTDLISFYDRIMAFGDREKTVAVILLYLSKFDFDFM